ncbi:MAG: hypothetical protein U0O41_01550 [Clostridia bacterium]|jgi:hypothetical protein
MTNEAFKSYVEKEFNAAVNYEKILAKEKNIFSKKIFNFVATLLVIAVTGLMSRQIYAKIKWNIEFKEYKEYKESPSISAKGKLKEVKDTRLCRSY